MNTSTLTAEPTDVGDVGSIEQRQASLMDEIRSDPSQPAGEEDEGGESRPAAAPPAVASPADSDAAARRAERRKRLDEVTARERQAVDHKERLAAVEKQTARAKEAEDKLAAMTQGTFDRAVAKDPLAMMKLMEDAGVDAGMVADAIQKSISDPSYAASRAAREAVSPEITELRTQLKAQNDQIAALLDRDAKTTAAQRRHQDEEAFANHVGASAAQTPLSAALLKHDRAEFLLMADMASDDLPEGAGPRALADALEDLLDTKVRAVANKYSAIYGSPSPTSQAMKPRPGAVQPNTVSNSLVQERGSLVDEDDFAKLTVEERAKILSR